MSEVVFHAGSKLSWLESIARDRSATAFDLRVAMAISNRTKGDGIARTASQQWVARYIGATERGVRKSIVHLCALGYLQPIKNTLGDWMRRAPGIRRQRTRDGISAADGRTTRNGGSGFNGETRNSETRNGETRNSEAANPEQRSSEPGTAVPLLSSSSNKESLARAGAHARDPDVAAWLEVRKRLADEVGRDVFDAWFDKVALARIAKGTVTLRPPTKFHGSYIEGNFLARTLRAWQAHDPTITAVRLDHRATAVGVATEPLHGFDAGNTPDATDGAAGDQRLDFLRRLQGRR